MPDTCMEYVCMMSREIKHENATHVKKSPHLCCILSTKRRQRKQRRHGGLNRCCQEQGIRGKRRAATFGRGCAFITKLTADHPEKFRNDHSKEQEAESVPRSTLSDSTPPQEVSPFPTEEELKRGGAWDGWAAKRGGRDCTCV